MRVHNDLGPGRVTEPVPCHLEVLPDDERLDGSELETAEGVVDAEAVLAGVLRDLVKVLLDQPEERYTVRQLRREEKGTLEAPLLLHEFHVAETLRSELDSLIETVLSTIRDIDDLDDFGDQSAVEHV